MTRKRRATWIAGLILSLTSTTIPAFAQEDEPNPTPLFVLCIRKIVNLPGFDLPDQPITFSIGGEAECPPRGG